MKKVLEGTEGRQPGEALGMLLKKKGLTLAAAESCTGGLVMDRLTDVPGCSAWIRGGVVAYSNDLKSSLLEVSPEDLRNAGAVSREVALQMARGVAGALNADIGVSTTGIAGPGGGSADKPVGTVWIGYWSRDRHFALNTRFEGNRRENKEETVALVLEVIRRSVMGRSTLPGDLEPHPA